ncbi:MAG: CBS domain-containing protein [Pirellulales bacterium]
MSAGRICTREVDFADPNESAWKAAERMHQRSVGALVILNESTEPTGILTDRDLIVRVMAKGLDPNRTTIADVMTMEPKTISEDASIESAMFLMRRGGFRRLPVVDANGKLVGLLSLDDVLMLLAEEFSQIGQLLERETPQGVATESVA